MLLTATAESGSNGANVLAGNEWDIVDTSNASTNVYSNDYTLKGSMAYKSTTGATGNNGFVAWSTSLPVGSANIWLREYGYIASMYTGQLCQFQYLGSPILRVSINASAKLRILDPASAALGVSTTSLPTGAMFRLEVQLTTSASPTGGTVEIRLFLSPDDVTPTETMGPYTGIQTATDIDTIMFGAISANVGTLYHDSDAISNDGWIGPDISIPNSGTLAWLVG